MANALHLKFTTPPAAFLRERFGFSGIKIIVGMVAPLGTPSAVL